MLLYQHPTEARTFFAPDIEPSLDSALPVLYMSGLNNYNLPRPLSHIATNQMPTAVGSGPGGNYVGYDFRNAYLPNVALTGVGQYVGLVEFDDYYHPTPTYPSNPDDVAMYENEWHLPNLQPTIIPVDGGVSTPNQSGDALEVALDIDMAIAMAPGLSGVFVYEAPLPLNQYPWFTSAAIDDILLKLAY